MREGQQPSRHFRRILTRKGYKAVLINPHIKKKIILRKRYVRIQHKENYGAFFGLFGKSKRQEEQEKQQEKQKSRMSTGGDFPDVIENKSVSKKSKLKTRKITIPHKTFEDPEQQQEYDNTQAEAEALTKQAAALDLRLKIKHYTPLEESKIQKKKDTINARMDILSQEAQKIKTDIPSLQNKMEKLELTREQEAAVNKKFIDLNKRGHTMNEIIKKLKGAKTIEEFNNVIGNKNQAPAEAFFKNEKVLDNKMKWDKLMDEHENARSIVNRKELLKLSVPSDELQKAKDTMKKTEAGLADLKKKGYSGEYTLDYVKRALSEAKALKAVPKGKHRDDNLIKDIEKLGDIIKQRESEIIQKQTKQQVAEQQRKVKAAAPEIVRQHEMEAIMDTLGPKGSFGGLKAKQNLIDQMIAGDIKPTKTNVEKYIAQHVKNKKQRDELAKKVGHAERRLKETKEAKQTALEASKLGINKYTGKAKFSALGKREQKEESEEETKSTTAAPKKSKVEGSDFTEMKPSNRSKSTPPPKVSTLKIFNEELPGQKKAKKSKPNDMGGDL